MFFVKISFNRVLSLSAIEKFFIFVQKVVYSINLSRDYNVAFANILIEKFDKNDL